MFSIDVKKIEIEEKNTVLKKNLNLDINLDCFILISSSNINFAENILNNSLEFLIEKISKENTYNDLSIALENINAYIKTWREDVENKNDTLDMVIGILNENTYTFSNIGNSTVYLINKNAEVVELTERGENKKDFSYISSGKLLNGEIVISASVDILNYLSNSDLIDGLVLADDIEIFNKNIENIFENEILDESCIFSSLKITSGEDVEETNKFDILKNYLAKIIDNSFSKKIIGGVLFLVDKLKTKSKSVKNFLLLLFIVLGIIILYIMLGKLVNITTQTEEKESAKEAVSQIEILLKTASENTNNPEVFEKSVTEIETLVKQIESQKLYLNNIKKINDDLNDLKKSFYGIGIFTESERNLVYAFDENVLNAGKVIKIEKTDFPYIITEKSIIGPINSVSKPQIYTFSNLADNEIFVDAISVNSNIFILTNKSQIVRFAKGIPEYVSVIGQNKWEDTKQIGTFNGNLYTLGTDNQIYKHPANGTNFKAGETYLKTGDLTQIGELLSMGIDGGFYLLKKDLSMVKFFSEPYRLESLSLNRLPKNYNLEEGSKVEIKVGKNYVYMLLGNKIWIFKPNSIDWKNTQSLTYMGQIEGATKKIKNFYVSADGEILVLNEVGVYKLNFEVSDDKVIIK